MPIKRRISDFKPLFTNLAQTSHYEVRFGGLGSSGGELISYLNGKGITQRFIAEDCGLLCSSASLPTTNFAMATINGNHMGATETFAHTRQYTPITLEFYVDKNYNALKFMESWMEFIASGSHNPIRSPLASVNQNSDAYLFRMQYPEYYKSNETKITKFDKDYNKEIEYTFRGLFPSAIASLGVSYSTSNILSMAVTFQYDRYIAGKSSSLSNLLGNNNNFVSNFVGNTRTSIPNRLATGREELINRNLNLGTGRLDDSRPIGIS